jgi:type IX secretion system PorP/SprF family membrane protein
MKNFYLLSCLLLFMHNKLFAQDIHSSLNPLNAQLNPALTGMVSGDFTGRFQASYRRQWATVMRDGAYTTTQASIEQAVFQGKYNFFGLGISGFYDQAGVMPLRQTQVNVNGSFIFNLYHHERSRQFWFMSAGLQLGVAQRRFDFSKIRWSEQFTGEKYNLSLPSGEPFPNDFNGNRVFGDASVGLAFNYTHDEATNKLKWLNFGGSFMHLSGVMRTPIANTSFFDGTINLLRTRWVAHFSALLNLNNNFNLLPMVYFTTQAKAQEINIGTYMNWYFGNTHDWWAANALQLGLMSRFNKGLNTSLSMDALIPAVRFDFSSLTVGLSYDVNVSTLRQGSYGQGGFEFSLGSRWFLSQNGKPRKRGLVVCP